MEGTKGWRMSKVKKRTSARIKRGHVHGQSQGRSQGSIPARVRADLNDTRARFELYFGMGSSETKLGILP